MTTTNRCHRLALALGLALPGLAAAHDLVLVPESSGDLTVKFGHPGDWQPTGRDRLLDLTIETGAIARPIAEPRPEGLTLVARQVAAPGAATLVSARYDNGLWLTVPGAPGSPPRILNTSRALLPEGGSTLAAIKFAKGLYAAADDTAAYGRVIGHRIELVPQSNPAAARPGGRLKVLVLLNGRPLAGAGVELTDPATTGTGTQPVHRTDASGIAEVPIGRTGLNVLSVDHEVPNDGTVAGPMTVLPVERIAMIATYAFQVH